MKAEAKKDNVMDIHSYMEKLPPNIYKRLNSVMKEVKYILKEDKMVNGQYKFVSHDAVAARLHGPLTDNGIVMLPSVLELIQQDITIADKSGPKSATRTTCKIEVFFINVDNPEDKVSVIYYGCGIDPSDKGIGKAITYAVKYALLKTFCLETGDDPEKDTYEFISKDEAHQEQLKKVSIQEEQEKLNLFLSSYSLDDEELIKKYLNEFASHFKLTISKTLENYKDKDKFAKHFEPWKAKQLERSKQ